MKKIIVPSMMALGLMACSEQNGTVSNEQVPTVLKENVIPYTQHDEKSLWQHINEDGVEYFENQGTIPAELASPSRVKCENGLRMDEHTIYFDEMEGLYCEGSMVEGVCGKAVSLKSGEVAPLSINMILPLEVGTVEFYFKPNADFFDETSRTLLGNDESRIHFFVQGNKIVFQKNHADKHFFVKGDLKLNENDWNHIAGQWDGTTMSVWVNGEMVGQINHPYGYQTSTRAKKYGNLLVIGYKSSCCMEGPGQYSAMTTSGAFDQIRISNIARYTSAPIQEDEKRDTTIVESSSSVVRDSVIESSSSVESDTIFFEDFDRDFKYSISLTEGYPQRAALLAYGEMQILDALNDTIPQGTFEFDFKPGKKFNEMLDAALAGSDEGRMTIQKVDGELRFYKNRADEVNYVGAVVELNNGWNKIAGQWDGEVMSLYVNGKRLAYGETNTGYSPSLRSIISAPNGNSIVVGHKRACCTTNRDLYSDGAIDNILVTKKLLYVK